MLTIESYLEAKRLGGRHVGKAASPRTISAYRTSLERASLLLGKPLRFMTDADGDRLMEELENAGYTNSTKALILSALNGAFTWGIANGYVTTNPVAGIMAPSIERKVPVVLSKAQIQQFFAAIRSPKYRLFFQLMYYAGCRAGEVRQLRRDDVYDQGIVIRGKGKKQRFNTLPYPILSQLDTYKHHHRDSKYVFYAETANGKKDQPMSLVNAYRIFHETAEALGLPEGFRAHNLRATAATHIHEASGDLAVTQEFLGHASPITTRLYAQISNERIHAAARKAFD